ncbi:endonuclease/exonuclease/phosphatase family protein [Salinimicrobium sediminilitoris]|uniref:endonuclease/exonuclease/phosphatase family protein n=1 Tax=Salinimicrobium sediminilitoris TaxID=2876715 RepID=UPI001E37AADB|nr:endonuclease/exonuclease/phosphatase family protein [Salinimicrobium sediminilitoris]MCC8358367.1 endonuclease/exonuclease/phosphatase family protein [Salinimicrobium sediminilitoris]
MNLTKNQKYRIATWNLDRPRNNSKANRIKSKLNNIAADIFILTETSELINLAPEYKAVKSKEFELYKDQPWITIWSRWKVVEEIETSNSFRTACCLIEAPFGPIIIYGTIIPYHMAGVNGNRYPDKGKKVWQLHVEDIIDQSSDWQNIMDNYPDVPFLVAGDFNQTRDGLPKGYGTIQGRKLLTQKLTDSRMSCVTEIDFHEMNFLTPDGKGRKRRNIDHICISKSLCEEINITAGAWNQFSEDGFAYSDHNGTYVDFY